MAYKLSDRNEIGRSGSLLKNNDRVDLGALATVFILFGLLSLATSWFYSAETVKIIRSNYYPNSYDSQNVFGPIKVSKEGEVYEIFVRAALADQSWSYVEGEVLNEKKKYLFAFGEELSYYYGSDWKELHNDYSLIVTFPEPGNYYLKFQTESSLAPRSIRVEVTNRVGSGLPHLWFGIITLLIGVIMNEIKNLTIIKTLDKLAGS
ncbi:hypothetical protein [Vibrio splendidus]|uniref:hypothetical protein n=1 Tax=Vibrio splendidus TaxID=29497 RepID=UPI000C8626BC|nr:hypothetical protein [Vibrio splendidus]PMM11203.1 hypothetical protein BCT62_01865 [Vibrio splendidus]PMN31029.1 hypothetical protein BCT36_06520 [Vibrio splendidus]